MPRTHTPPGAYVFFALTRYVDFFGRGDFFHPGANCILSRPSRLRARRRSVRCRTSMDVIWALRLVCSNASIPSIPSNFALSHGTSTRPRLGSNGSSPIAREDCSQARSSARANPRNCCGLSASNRRVSSDDDRTPRLGGDAGAGASFFQSVLVGFGLAGLLFVQFGIVHAGFGVTFRVRDWWSGRNVTHHTDAAPDPDVEVA